MSSGILYLPTRVRIKKPDLYLVEIREPGVRFGRVDLVCIAATSITPHLPLEAVVRSFFWAHSCSLQNLPVTGELAGGRQDRMVEHKHARLDARVVQAAGVVVALNFDVIVSSLSELFIVTQS